MALAKGARGQTEFKGVGSEIQPRPEPEQVAGHLPSGTPAPLVAVAPPRVEDLRQGGASVANQPTPTLANLVEHKVRPVPLKEKGKDIMGKVGGDQTSLKGQGVVIARSVRLVGETVVEMDGEMIQTA